MLKKIGLIGVAAMLALTPGATAAPTVRIVCGIPGDEAHHDSFNAVCKRLRTVFEERYGVPKERVRVTYGPKSEGFVGVSTKENVLAELKAAAAARKRGEAQWLIFVGHANEGGGEPRLNLPGPDVTAKELGAALQGDGAPMVIWFTTTIGGRFVKALAGENRIIAAATRPDQQENETLFPEVLAKALEDGATDVNGDKKVAVDELFVACKAGVMAAYESEKLIQREHAVLDGDGDGRATSRPSRNDAAAASRQALAISRKQELLDKFD